MDVATLCTRAVELADDDDALEELLAGVATELDREQLITTHLALAAAFGAKYDSRWVHRALATARNALPADDARWIEVTIAYIVALVDDFERERASERARGCRADAHRPRARP